MIDSLTMMRFNSLKAYFFLPVLSLVSLFILPVWLYWSVPLQASMMYSKVDSLQQATHFLVQGRDGNIEIVQIKDHTETVR